jgi:hypothetical protein
MASTPRARAIESYARRSLEDDHKAHKDVGAQAADQPSSSSASSAAFAATPNTGERPTWAPKR